MKYYILLSICFLLSCTQNKKDTDKFIRDEAFEKKLQEQLILAEDGETIELPEGNFLFTKSISIEGKNNITIKGKGKNKTKFSFINQNEGAEGMNITNCNNIVLEDFTIQDAHGDNFKLKSCNGIVLRNLNATWTTGADSSNGNYGYYPVECQNVLIEKCDVSYCADAGVYVGQSINVTVRNCVAFKNVCGIEIENCINADVYDNHSYDNAGGIVVYDLPGLPLKHGRNCRVFNNKVEHNNFKNFAKPGSYVSDIPSGSGLIIMAYDSVEVYGNTFKDNKTLGCCAVSYYVTQRPINDSLYTAYATSIYIHDNEFKRKMALVPDLSSDLGKLILAISKTPVDIIYDANYSKEMSDANGSLKANYKSCFSHNGDIKFINLNAYQSPDIMHVLKSYDTDITKFNCTLPSLIGNKN
jgi:parallel beta-helix repeat protein